MPVQKGKKDDNHYRKLTDARLAVTNPVESSSPEAGKPWEAEAAIASSTEVRFIDPPVGEAGGIAVAQSAEVIQVPVQDEDVTTNIMVRQG